MMFINDIDAFNANINGTLYRPQNSITTNNSATNSLQSYDTTLHLQSNTNSLTFACQQKSSTNGYSISPPMPQTTISYSTSRHDLASSNNNIYSSSIYSDSTQQQQLTAVTNPTISNLIPLNITIYNPALSCNYNNGLQNSFVTSPQFPQLTTIPTNLQSYTNFPQKYVYKTKLEDLSGTLNSDYQYGMLSSTKTTLNKYYSKTTSNQPYYINPKRVSQQQQDNIISKVNPITVTTATPNTEATKIYLTNNATTILTPLNQADLSTQPTIIPIRNSIQLVNSNTRLSGIKKRKKRFKKPIELRKILPKNSLMLLHELMPNIEYRFIKQSGPIHKPIFTMSVDISEHSFEGIGKTKKEARMMAADKALKFLMDFPEYIQKNKSIKDQNTSVNSNDKTNDDNNDINNENDDQMEKMDDEDEEENEDENENENVNENDEIKFNKNIDISVNIINNNNNNDNNSIKDIVESDVLSKFETDLKNNNLQHCANSIVNIM